MPNIKCNTLSPNKSGVWQAYKYLKHNYKFAVMKLVGLFSLENVRFHVQGSDFAYMSFSIVFLDVY